MTSSRSSSPRSWPGACTRRTRVSSGPGAAARGSTNLPEVRDVTTSSNAVAELVRAHRDGALVALRTSGTTGTTRSVVRTTASWFDSFPHVSALLGLDRSSHLVVPGPLSATMNLFSAVHATHVGARLTLGPRPSGGTATHLLLTPAALSRALAQREDLRGLHVLVAGDRLPPLLHDRTLAAGASAVSHYYGSAELSFVAWGPHAEGLRPFPGVAVEGRENELWVRSPYLFERYDGPAGPLRRGADGFVTVGDRGHVEDGRVVVSGRDGGTVVTAGATVRIADVEAVLSVAGEVCVVGIPHPDLGQVLCAVVTDPEALPAARSVARERLDPTQRPRRWVVRPRLPLSAAGKVDRGRLTALLTEGATGPAPAGRSVELP